MATNDNTGGTKPSPQDQFAAPASSADSTAPADAQPTETPAPTDAPAAAEAETPVENAPEAAPAADEAESASEAAAETPADETAEAETTEAQTPPLDQGAPGETNPGTVPKDTTPPETPIQSPTDTLSEREAKLRAVQKAHEEWVASNVHNEPPSTQKTPDASQFAMDTELPQEDFVAAVDKHTKDAGGDPLENAVSRLNDLLKKEGLANQIEVRRKGA